MFHERERNVIRTIVLLSSYLILPYILDIGNEAYRSRFCSYIVVFKALTLKTVHGRRIFHTWEETEALVADGKIDVNKVITHRFPMSKFEDAFKVLFEGKACKIILYPAQ